ncbi:MAG: 4-hydroxy-3-methylbut-2-enyl diphosphate reductase [Acidimicrobiales bacterium]
MRVESIAVGGASAVIGAGRSHALRGGSEIADRLGPGTAVALVGVAGGLSPELQPGDTVVASELRDTESSVPLMLSGAAMIAAELKRAGIKVRMGPLVSSPRYVRADEREALAGSGAVAVDMESAWVMRAFPDHPRAVVRCISDTADCGPVRGGLRGLRALRAARGPLERWARACGAHEVRLASPRSFCAGVDRAIEIVEQALGAHAAPVYVRRQIVHNLHVVRSLEAKGAVFVDEVDEVPPGAVLVLAAHGVSPQVRDQATQRDDLEVIDATCPLVAKVHNEARRCASEDENIVIIGHADHEEVIGTLGEAPGRCYVVENVEDVGRLEIPTTPERQRAYLTQTTLATDETAEIVAALRARFPGIKAPLADDICYATQNRQDAVRRLARQSDLVVVVGSENSSNAARLVEVARREGCRAELIEDAEHLALGWLAGVKRIGLTAGASAPESLVSEVIEAFRALGPVALREETVTEETVHFPLPTQVR